MASTGSIERLLKISSAGLYPGAPDEQLLGGEHAELGLVLSQRNGFYAFESALHVFSSGGGELSLEEWNSEDLWRDCYGELANGHLFFAQDIFGCQFSLSNGGVLSFDPETGTSEFVANSLEDWASKVIAEYEFMTGYPLAHEWQVKNRPLEPGERLLPKQPFVVGGEFEVANLYPLDAVKGMRFRGDLAVQIRDLPDGAEIDFQIVP